MDFSSPITWQVVSMACALAVVLTSGIAAVLTFTQQAARTRELQGWLTGGDSFPHLYPLPGKNEKGENVVAYFLKVRGKKYPLYDVQVRVQDLDKGPFMPDGSVIPSQAVAVPGTLTMNTDKFPIGFLVFPYPQPGRRRRPVVSASSYRRETGSYFRILP